MSAWRAAADRPKETLEIPSTVRTPGIAAFIRFMPSIVSSPSRLLSSMPVLTGSARASKKRSGGQKPVTTDGQVVDRLCCT